MLCVLKAEALAYSAVAAPQHNDVPTSTYIIHRKLANVYCRGRPAVLAFILMPDTVEIAWLQSMHGCTSPVQFVPSFTTRKKLQKHATRHLCLLCTGRIRLSTCRLCLWLGLLIGAVLANTCLLRVGGVCVSARRLCLQLRLHASTT